MAKVNRVGRRLAYRARKDPPFDEPGAISPTENEHRNASGKKRTNECDDQRAYIDDCTNDSKAVESDSTGATVGHSSGLHIHALQV
jgi:hypothetical protein